MRFHYKWSLAGCKIHILYVFSEVEDSKVFDRYVKPLFEQKREKLIADINQVTEVTYE